MCRMDTNTRVGLVTGGGGSGGSGLGAAIARALADAGFRVVVTDVDATAAEAVAARVRAEGGDALGVELDVTDEANWTKSVDEATEAYGGVDVLVNSAGENSFGPDPMDLDVWDRIMAINARGTFLGMRAVIPTMRRRGRGDIVNISSVAGRVPHTGMHLAYGASKAAIAHMTRAVAGAEAPTIRVNAVAPGMLAAAAERNRSVDTTAPIPMGRLGTAEEIAATVMFLVSPAASYLTGVEIVADGGYTSTRTV